MTKEGPAIYQKETKEVVLQEKPQKGSVVAVGSGRLTDDGKTVPMVVKVGLKVMYKKWGGNEVKVEGKEWMLIEEKDIMAIVE